MISNHLYWHHVAPNCKKVIFKRHSVVIQVCAVRQFPKKWIGGCVSRVARIAFHKNKCTCGIFHRPQFCPFKRSFHVNKLFDFTSIMSDASMCHLLFQLKAHMRRFTSSRCIVIPVTVIRTGNNVQGGFTLARMQKQVIDKFRRPTVAVAMFFFHRFTEKFGGFVQNPSQIVLRIVLASIFFLRIGLLQDEADLHNYALRFFHSPAMIKVAHLHPFNFWIDRTLQFQSA